MAWENKAYKQMKQAIKMFGEYTYDDKGPDDVMDVSALADELMQLKPQKAANSLLALRILKGNKKDKIQRDQLFSAVMWYLQEWDEFFEIVDDTPELQDF